MPPFSNTRIFVTQSTIIVQNYLPEYLYVSGAVKVELSVHYGHRSMYNHKVSYLDQYIIIALIAHMLK